MHNGASGWKWGPRRLENGRLDPTFGTNGVVVWDQASDGRCMSLALDSLDRIVVKGHSTSLFGARDMTIWRYNQ